MAEKKLNILLIEPFYSGSHKSWVDELLRFSQHNYSLITLPGRLWRWRMHLAAVTLAQKIPQQRFDLVLVSDMLNLPLFIALAGKQLHSVPVAIYFHENQISYPLSKYEKGSAKGRDISFGLINFTSVLVADHIFFNSQFHFEDFYSGLPQFLDRSPEKLDYNLDQLKAKSSVLSLAVDLNRFDNCNDSDRSKKCNKEPVLLWNHRREDDKNPYGFLCLLRILTKRAIDFKLILLGEESAVGHQVFADISKEFASHILYNGYAASAQEYSSLVRQADILPVTSQHDFFGISVVEAAYCGVVPLLPNHLSYPSLFSPFKELFYKPGATAQLADLIEIFLKEDHSQLIQRIHMHLVQYDWSKMIDHYDTTLRSIVLKVRHIG